MILCYITNDSKMIPRVFPLHVNFFFFFFVAIMGSLSFPCEADEETTDAARVKRNGVAVPYWWLPGSNQAIDNSISSVSCGDPGTPAFGSSLFQSLAAGSLVVHSCNPGYKLVGAKLRLCQSNGQWTPEIPSCMCECQTLRLGRLLLIGLLLQM